MRIRKVKSDNWYLEVLFTLDDPTYYARPWSWMRDYAWRPDMVLFKEYNCELQTGAKDGLIPAWRRSQGTDETSCQECLYFTN